MKMHRYLLHGIACLATVSVSGVEPPDGVITEPHDWECAYAYSDTTCERMMQAWANDVDLEGEVRDFVGCGECDPVFKLGYEGTQYLIGYRCNKLDGYAIKTEDETELVQVYGSGGTTQGWRVSDWKFEECLLVFECAEECGDSLNGYTCFVDSGYSVGRWIPVLEEACPTTPQGGSGSGQGSGEESGGTDDRYSDSCEYP